MLHIKFSLLFVVGLLTVFACLPSTKKAGVVTVPTVSKKADATVVSTNHHQIERQIDRTLISPDSQSAASQFLSPISIPTSQAASTECDTAYTVCSQIWNAVAAICALDTGDLRGCYSKYLENRAQCVSDATDGRCTVILH